MEAGRGSAHGSSRPFRAHVLPPLHCGSNEASQSADTDQLHFESGRSLSIIRADFHIFN